MKSKKSEVRSEKSDLRPPISGLYSPIPDLHFFAGKGGVGKTTCAAARAVAAARAGRAVLLISTDPAHSLGDVLGVRLAANPVPVPLRAAKGRLRAVEIDARRAFVRWMRGRRGALADILEHGTWLDRIDIDALLALSIPGVDELMGILEITRLARGSGTGAPDEVIVDTAPTGHTLRLLAAPETVQVVSGVLDALQEEHRLIRGQLARVAGAGAEATDRLIAELQREAAAGAELLRDRRRTSFHWVMLPEALSWAETEDGLAALRRASIPVAELVVNCVTPPGPRCRICDPRRTGESAVLRLVAARARRLAMRTIPATADEPRGIDALSRIGAALLGPPDRIALPRQARPLPRRGPSPIPAGASRLRLRLLENSRVLFFGGKGGVGKTTCASAVALRLAERDPSRRILLLSTDPAHSLADVFDTPIGDRESSVRGGPGNLRVREIDAAAAMASRRRGLEAALAEFGLAVGVEGVHLAGSRVDASRLLDLAPPGIDELFGMQSILDALQRFSLVVVDMAPTGHALRLLEAPALAREWVDVFMRVLLKYRSIAVPGKLGAELVELSKSVRALRTLMHDPAKTRSVVVSRAAEVPRRETARLLARLRRLRLTVAAVVVNAVTTAPDRCPRCRRVAGRERRELMAFGRWTIIQAPLVAPPPRGAAALAEWGRAWTA